MALSALPAPEPCRCRPVEGRDIPVRLLTLDVESATDHPDVASFGVGYELNVWRAEALAGHLLEWTIDYARRDRSDLPPGRALRIMQRAVKATFGNGNDHGQVGELLLHIICRQFFGSDIVLSKVWFKTADNDTYKGFDGIHCVHNDQDLELWLGEAKFYKRINQAIDAIIRDVNEHFTADYLRNEFAIVSDKIDEDHPHAGELLQLLDPNTRLEDVFTRIVVPVLVTYDSAAVQGHTADCPTYRQGLEEEAVAAQQRLRDGLNTGLPVRVKLLLVPLGTKEMLLQALKKELGL